jgi:hypothetical protein
MDVNEDVSAEMQMCLVRICRNEKKASAVWLRMKSLFPEYSTEQIKSAVRPVIESMMKSI